MEGSWWSVSGGAVLLCAAGRLSPLPSMLTAHRPLMAVGPALRSGLPSLDSWSRNFVCSSLETAARAGLGNWKHTGSRRQNCFLQDCVSP